MSGASPPGSDQRIFRPPGGQGPRGCCCGCLLMVVVLFLTLSASLLAFALIPNSYPAYPRASSLALESASYPSLSSLPWIHSDGKVMLNSSGDQVLLRGMDLTGLLQAKDINPGPAPTAEDFSEMASDGFNVIRLPISWSLLERRRGQFSTSYLDQIRQTVGEAAAQGIYTILDLHNIDWSIDYGGDGAPGWATAGGLPRSAPLPSPWNRHVAPGVLASYGIFWADFAGWQQDVTQVWTFVARAFRQDSAVAGFDLWNEPHPFPIPSGLFEAKYLLPFEAQLITHMAQVAPRQMWISEQTLDFGLPTYVGKLPYPNQVFSSHVFATLLEPPWQAPKPEYATPLTLLRDQAKTAGGAPWVGEIGSNPGSAGTAWIGREMNELDKYLLGWAYWDWNQKGSWAFIRQPGRLKLVARAYPKATPGNLTKLSYDPSTGQLQVDFRGLTRGRPLLIAVPHFLTGYRVSSSDPAADISSRLSRSHHTLSITIHDQRTSHLVRVSFS